jgi:hypothetical protein
MLSESKRYTHQHHHIPTRKLRPWIVLVNLATKCEYTNKYRSSYAYQTLSQTPSSPRTKARPTSSTSHLSSSHQPHPSLLPSSSRKRRRHPSHEVDHSDPIVGLVTASGKFRCSNSDCSDLSFGRQADFRRHYEHQHALRKVLYFCPVNGCSRSNGGGTGRKGKSFGTREDKMREHVRTVHEKKGKKMKLGVEVEDEDDEVEDGSEEYYEYK